MLNCCGIYQEYANVNVLLLKLDVNSLTAKFMPSRGITAAE